MGFTAPASSANTGNVRGLIPDNSNQQSGIHVVSVGPTELVLRGAFNLQDQYGRYWQKS